MYSLPPHSAVCCFYPWWFDHIYHAAILLMSESAVNFYKYDRQDSDSASNIFCKETFDDTTAFQTPMTLPPPWLHIIFYFLNLGAANTSISFAPRFYVTSSQSLTHLAHPQKDIHTPPTADLIGISLVTRAKQFPHNGREDIR